MAYVYLALIGLLPAAWIVYRRRKAALAATFFFGGALVMLADWIAFGWFQLYSYHPHLSSDPIVDNMLGELLAETVFVAGFCVVLETCLPGWPGAVAGTVIVTAVELLFLHLGVFVHHGWSVWYTAVGFPVFFTIVSAFTQRALKRGLGAGWLRSAARVAIAFWLAAILTAGLRMGRLVRTNIHLFTADLSNQSFGRFFTYVPVIVPLTWWTLRASGQERLTRLLVSTLLAVGINWIFNAIRFQQFRPPWNAFLDGLSVGVLIAVAIMLDHWLIADLRSERVRA